MATPMTKEEFATPAGRKRAWAQLMLGDHGVLRLFYSNTHEVSPGKLWRSFQPAPRDIKTWGKRGIRTIINLRGDKPNGRYFLEEEACRKQGLEFVSLRIFSRDAPARETLHDVRRLFRTIQYPAMMHCKSGADRVGLMSVLYLFFEENLPLDQAMAQLSFKYGHIRQGKTGILDTALESYIEYANARGVSLSNVDEFFTWVDNEYDPIALKAEFKPEPISDFLTDKILRRE